MSGILNDWVRDTFARCNVDDKERFPVSAQAHFQILDSPTGGLEVGIVRFTVQEYIWKKAPPEYFPTPTCTAASMLRWWFFLLYTYARRDDPYPGHSTNRPTKGVGSQPSKAHSGKQPSGAPPAYPFWLNFGTTKRPNSREPPAEPPAYKMNRTTSQTSQQGLDGAPGQSGRKGSAKAPKSAEKSTTNNTSISDSQHSTPINTADCQARQA